MKCEGVILWAISITFASKPTKILFLFLFIPFKIIFAALLGFMPVSLKVEPNSILAIAGPDEGYKNQLLDLAISMGINKSVFFVGMLDGQDRLEFLALIK